MEIDNTTVDQMEESLDLRLYFSLFLHWFWLMLLAAAIAGAASYFLSIRMMPIYQSSTTVLVNEAPATKASDYSSVMMSEQLTSTYSQMMAKEPVLLNVAQQVGLTNPVEDIKEWITVTPVRDTQLIQVKVETTNPAKSAAIANAVVTVFAEQIQEIQTQRFAQSKGTLEAQLSDIEKQIAEYSSAAETAATYDERERLDTKVAQYREIYSNLLLTYEQVRLSEAQAVSSVVQVEPATPNLTPVKPKVLQNTLLAAVVGFLLAAGAVVAREALDDTIKAPDEIARKFKLPVLGVVNHHRIDKNSLITLSDPRSPTAEAYRTLRTNVSYTSVDKPLRTLMVTSAEPGEGKTTTITNLAVVMAQNGRSVILTDCDLRHPSVHTYFNLENRFGLTNLFTQRDEVLLDATLHPTSLPTLAVMTTGALPPNPAELLGSRRMQTILESMRQQAEIVLVDTPPTLAVTDGAVLAPTVDGVLLVVRPGKTRASALRQTLEQLRQVKANVLGVVLNDVVTRGRAYGYHYKYYRNYAAYQNYYGGKKHKAGKEKTK